MDIGDKLKIGLFIILITGGLAIHFSIDSDDKPVVAMSRENYKAKNHKIDSLNHVIDSLQIEYKILEDGCDSRESRYEDILSEYQWGLSYLEDYHPVAYKDFHRIIGMKERYSKKLDKENKQRLDINE